MNQSSPFSTFECIRRFDELDHTLILGDIACENMEALTLSLERLQREDKVIFGSPKPTIDTFVNTVTALIHNREKVAAIKTVRNEVGLGLKEAKDVVDVLDGCKSPGDQALGVAQHDLISRFVNAGYRLPPVKAPEVKSTDEMDYLFMWVATCVEMGNSGLVQDAIVVVVGTFTTSNAAWRAAEDHERSYQGKCVRYQVRQHRVQS